MTTKDDVQQSINSRLRTEPTLIEGGTVQDIVGSVSYELANIIDTKINKILDNAFVTTADEEHLLIKGSELGIYKKEATNAYVMATITNASPNILITEDIKAKTEASLIFNVVSETRTNEEGYALVKMECQTKGAIGCINEGTLNSFFEEYEGLQHANITNLSKGYNGYDDETTEEYRARILEYMKDDACNSNIADYTYWAKSVAGVKYVVVKDAISAGAGKVDVYISAYNNEAVSNELINSVKQKIEKEQIINAMLSVYPLQYLQINISADISLKENGTLSGVEEKFIELLNEYLNQKPTLVSYLYISNLFFEIDEIEDVSNYLLNGGIQSVQAGELQVPVIGNVSLSLEEE